MHWWAQWYPPPGGAAALLCFIAVVWQDWLVKERSKPPETMPMSNPNRLAHGMTHEIWALEGPAPVLRTKNLLYVSKLNAVAHILTRGAESHPQQSLCMLFRLTSLKVMQPVWSLEHKGRGCLVYKLPLGSNLSWAAQSAADSTWNAKWRALASVRSSGSSNSFVLLFVFYELIPYHFVLERNQVEHACCS